MKLTFIVLRYFLFILFILFISSEVVLRILKNESWVIHQYPKIYRPDTLIGYKGIPRINGYIRRPSIDKKFKLNNQGFYGPDFNVSKGDSIFRIIVTGTSGVEGVWANHQESFPLKLNNEFLVAGYKVEVINCAISGLQRDLQNLRLIEHHLMQFQPDIILHEVEIPIVYGNYHRDTYHNYSILYTGNNETERTHSQYIAQKKVELIEKHKLFTNLYDLSFCLRAIVRKSDPQIRNTLASCLRTYSHNLSDSWQYSSFKTYSFEESISELNKLHEKLKDHDCKLLLYSNNTYNKKVFFDNKDIINFAIIFLNIQGENLQHEYDGHLNEKGHKLIAKELFLKLSNHFIPQNYKPN